MSTGLLLPPRRRRGHKTTLVELVGPAGVGKSTLAGALADAHPNIRCDLSLWGLPRVDLLAGAASLVPVAVRTVFSGRRLRGSEAMQMVRLAALRLVVDRVTRRAPSVILMDEGPVFALAWLEVFFERARYPWRTRWRDGALASWAGRLDGIIRLKARDEVLAERIRWRAKQHMVKDRTDPEIFDFTARFRAAFDRVLAAVTARGVPIITIRTDDGSIGERSSRVRDALEELQSGH